MEDTLNNMLEWILYICTFVFLLPVHKTKNKWQIEAGAIAVFIAWMNFIWFLKRLPRFGIYVVLIYKVFISLLKVIFFVSYRGCIKNVMKLGSALLRSLIINNGNHSSTVGKSCIKASSFRLWGQVEKIRNQ